MDASNLRQLAAGVLVAAVIVVAYTGVLLVTRADVPPPDSPPGGTVASLMVDGVELSATAYFGQDFMPSVPDEGPPFGVSLRVTVNNTELSPLDNFSMPKTTIYYGGTKIPLVTFVLVLTQPEEFLVGPGETVTFSLHSEWEPVFSPDIAEGTLLYARVLIVWVDGSTTILTSPESGLQFTW